MIHILDDNVFLGGYGLRPGSHPESYPTSFLQNAHYPDADRLGFNHANDFSGHTGNFLHNKKSERFQTMTDLNQYFYGYFQALYVLDGAEAEAILEQSNADKAKILKQLGLHDAGGVSENYVSGLSADQIAELNLQTNDDLIEQSLMLRRHGNAIDQPTGSNSYPVVAVLDPLYGTGESSYGMTGPVAFRRNGFELWGAKGYDDGFVPYVSNKLVNEGGPGHLPDTYIMSKIFAGDGITTLKEYRK